MKQEVKQGQTDYTVLVKIRDTAGAPATGKAYTDVDIAYARVETDNDVTTSDVSPATLSALTDAHSDWGFKEVSATDHPGLYRLDIADAVFASGAWSAVVTVTGTGLDPSDLEFVLVPQAPYDGVNAHTVGGSTPETSAAIADAVWDETLAGHTTAGTTGEALDGAGGSGVSASAIADAVWDETRTGHTTANSYGKIMSKLRAIFGE